MPSDGVLLWSRITSQGSVLSLLAFLISYFCSFSALLAIPLDCKYPGLEVTWLKAQYWPLCFVCLCCCFGFHRSEASIVTKEFYSDHKQKPQNFQHHKNGRQEIAACSAQWAIPGL